jgi:hypothetical protein
MSQVEEITDIGVFGGDGFGVVCDRGVLALRLRKRTGVKRDESTGVDVVSMAAAGGTIRERMADLDVEVFRKLTLGPWVWIPLPVGVPSSWVTFAPCLSFRLFRDDVMDDTAVSPSESLSSVALTAGVVGGKE